MLRNICPGLCVKTTYDHHSDLHTNNAYSFIPLLQESAIVLSSKPTKEVPPHGLLYIGQREMAVVAPEDGNIIV